MMAVSGHSHRFQTLIHPLPNIFCGNTQIFWTKSHIFFYNCADDLLPGLAEGSDKMFRQLLHIRCRNILDEVKKEVLYGALKSDAWKERFELLAGKGWKKGE